MQGSSTYRPELEPSQQSTAFAALPPEQQQALEQENQALVSELSSLNQASEQKPKSTKFEHLPSMYRAVQITGARFTLVQSGAIVFTDRKEGQAVSACPQRRCRF